MEPKTPAASLLREIWPLLLLSAGLLVIVAVVHLFGDRIMGQSVTEALIRPDDERALQSHARTQQRIHEVEIERKATADEPLPFADSRPQPEVGQKEPEDAANEEYER